MEPHPVFHAGGPRGMFGLGVVKELRFKVNDIEEGKLDLIFGIMQQLSQLWRLDHCWHVGLSFILTSEILTCCQLQPSLCMVNDSFYGSKDIRSELQW